MSLSKAEELEHPIIYEEWDISGWNDRARRFLSKALESARTYGMQISEFDPLDEYVLVRGNKERLDRVQKIIWERYREYPRKHPILSPDELRFQSIHTHKSFIDKFKGEWGPC